MKIWIGSGQPSVQRVLERYFNSKENSLCQIDGYHLIRLDEPMRLARDLAVITVEECLPVHLIAAVRRIAPTLCVQAQQIVLRKTVISLSKKQQLRKICTIVCERILELFQTADVFTPDGLMQFGCKDIFGLLEREIREQLADNASLNSLEDESAKHSPLTEYIRIEQHGDEFHMFDSRGRQLHAVFSEELTPEEELLSALRILSPRLIDLSGLRHPELCAILKKLFPGKII